MRAGTSLLTNADLSRRRCRTTVSHLVSSISSRDATGSPRPFSITWRLSSKSQKTRSTLQPTKEHLHEALVGLATDGPWKIVTSDTSTKSATARLWSRRAAGLWAKGLLPTTPCGQTWRTSPWVTREPVALPSNSLQWPSRKLDHAPFPAVSQQ